MSSLFFSPSLVFLFQSSSIFFLPLILSIHTGGLRKFLFHRLKKDTPYNFKCPTFLIHNATLKTLIWSVKWNISLKLSIFRFKITDLLLNYMYRCESGMRVIALVTKKFVENSCTFRERKFLTAIRTQTWHLSLIIGLFAPY